MIVQRLIFLITMLIGLQAHAIGRLQDADFKTLTQITNAGGSAASLLNDSKIYVSANGINQTLSSAIGSGLIGGGAGVNLVSNGSFEASGISGWATFQASIDPSSLVPTSAPATCASCSLAISANTAAPLNGKTSLQLVGASTLTQGQGFLSTAFTVSPAYRGQVVTFKGLSSLISGSPVLSGTSSNTLALGVYDVTNAQWIQPNGAYAIASSGGPFAPASFQIPSNTTSLRVGVYVANTLSSAATFLFDDLAIAPGVNGYGLAGTDEVVTTPVVQAAGGGATRPTTMLQNTLAWSRVGDKMHIHFVQGWSSASGGVAGSGCYQVTIPGGYQADLSKGQTIVGTNANNQYVTIGQGKLQDGTNNAVGNAVLFTSTTFGIQGKYGANNTAGANIADQCWGSAAFGYTNAQGTGTYISADLWIPIVGWSTNVTQSSDFDGRNVTFVGTNTSNPGLTAGTPVPATAIKDAAGAWTGNTYVVPVAGDFMVSASMVSSASPGNLAVFVNGVNPNNNAGSTVSANGANSTVSTILSNLKVGDQIQVRGNINTNMNNININIARVPGSSPVLQASQSIIAIYGLTAAQTVAGGATVKYDTKVKDSNNMCPTMATTGTCIIPTSGTYRLGLTGQSTSLATLIVKLDGVSVGLTPTMYSGSVTPIVGTSTGFTANAGQVFSLVANQSASLSAKAADGYTNQFILERAGN